MVATLRILFDVLSFRLRRLEMANMVSAGAIMWALQVPVLWEGVVRMAFALALNVLVYLNNDYHDLEEDLDATGRERERTQFLADHRGAALAAQILLASALLGAAVWWGGQLWRPLVFGGGICWLYSAVLKRRPVVDILAMIVWGATMPMVGVVDDSTASWFLLAQLGLFSGVFESIQVLRDHDEDAVAKVRTSAVAFG
ncbi:MAG: UbiA family prenyltransferase, partial [Nannocystaceae bacterium]